MTIINPGDIIEDLGCNTYDCAVLLDGKIMSSVLCCDRELGWIIQIDYGAKRCECRQEFMTKMLFGKVELQRIKGRSTQASPRD